MSVLGNDNYPYTIPMNFYYSENEHKIYFHGAKDGHKIDSIKKHDRVSFCVYDKGVLVKGKKGLNYKSVIVFGRIKILEDREKTIHICRLLANQFKFDKNYIEDEIKNFTKFVMVLELTPEHISGKLVNES